MFPLYEDNHIIIVQKEPGEIVQGDKTGDTPLSETVAAYLKEKYAKPGNVFVGVVHRLDRPVGGVVIFAKTSKALARLNEMLREHKISKTYRAIVEGQPKENEGLLKDYLTFSQKNNKTYITDRNNPEAKEAQLRYRVLARGDKYSLVEIELLTGRKHQIRAQLSNMGHPIKGDLKYGARRSNSDGSISLRAQNVSFIHPVSKLPVDISALPEKSDPVWQKLEALIEQ